MALIAKMRAGKVTSHGGTIYPDKEKGEDFEAFDGVVRQEIRLDAVTGTDGTANAEWARYTPVGHVELTIDNREAFGQVEPGVEYYVEIRKVRGPRATGNGDEPAA